MDGAHLHSDDRGEEEAALAIYSDLIDRGLREVAIRAVFRHAPVEGVLPSDLADTFKKIKGAADARNRVIHANWGISDEYPAGLLAFSTRDLEKSVWWGLSGHRTKPRKVAADLYELADLTDIVERMYSVLDAIEDIMNRVLADRLRERRRP